MIASSPLGATLHGLLELLKFAMPSFGGFKATYAAKIVFTNTQIRRLSVTVEVHVSWQQTAV